MSNTDTAKAFFDACEGGKGWEGCKEMCHEGGSFSCQAGALADITTLEAYTDWMQGLFTPIPDLRPEIKAFAADEKRGSVIAFAVAYGTQTGEGGPVPPTGNTLTTDYVYVMEFDGDKIRSVTKIWNDGFALGQLGWT